jgi:hypothetical protein
MELFGHHEGEEAEQRDADTEYFHGDFRDRRFDGLLNYQSSHGARGVTSRGRGLVECAVRRAPETVASIDSMLLPHLAHIKTYLKTVS